MERLQQAIDKARDQRQGNIGEKIPKQSSRSNVDITKEKLAASSVEIPTSLNYVKTRSVKIDPKVLTENRVIMANPDDPRVENYRQLRTQILKLMNDSNWNTLAITSANEKAGKTLTAINLAIAISHEVNHTVLLVDLDLRNPSVAKYFDIDVEYGVVDYLKKHVELEKILINPYYERLVILPGRPVKQFSSELLSSPLMKRLVDDIRNRYQSRIIIFDLPPLLRNDDALLFTPAVDATLMVIEDGVTTEKDINRCVQLLEGANLIGTILNKGR